MGRYCNLKSTKEGIENEQCKPRPLGTDQPLSLPQFPKNFREYTTSF